MPVKKASKPAAKPAAKKPAAKPAAKKPAAKPAAKKPAAKPAAKKPAAKPAPKAASNGTKVYHVSKRASDGKWQVFIKGSDKVIKLFNTKVEAEDYCAQMAKNQGATLLVHKSKGANKGKVGSAKVKGGK